MYSDKILTCADCGQAFTFTGSEQEFYANRQFSEPRRCASCRAARKAQRNEGGYSSGSSYGSGSYGGHSSYGAPRAPREMFTTTCSNCGQEAKVPFQPTSGKPVYCNDCFAARRA